MINSLKTHILSTSLGCLEFSYEEDNNLIEIEKISLIKQEIIKTFPLSSIWINEQPAHYVNGFTATIIRHDNSLIQAEIREGKLYLFSNKFAQFNLEVKYCGQCRTFNVSPQLSMQGLLVLIKNEFKCSEFDLYRMGLPLQFEDKDTLAFMKITENTKLKIVKVEEEEIDQDYEEEDNREGPKFIKDRFVNFQDKKELSFDHKAPKWRTIIRGLNLEGKCLNQGCDAYEKNVCVQLGMGEFPISQYNKTTVCPYCPPESKDNKLENVINCIFWDCVYKIEGKKQNSTDRFSLEGKALSKSALSFAEATQDHQSNIVDWDFLKISTSEILKKEKTDPISEVSKDANVTGSFFSCVLI